MNNYLWFRICNTTTSTVYYGKFNTNGNFVQAHDVLKPLADLLPQDMLKGIKLSTLTLFNDYDMMKDFVDHDIKWGMYKHAYQIHLDQGQVIDWDRMKVIYEQ